MREDELLGLQWDDFDFHRSTVDLHRTVGVRKGQLIVNRPKSGKLRIVDLPSALAASLREVKSIRQARAALDGTEPSPWVFPSLTNTTKPLNASWFWRHVWAPLLNKAETRHIRVHDARHTYASIMLRRGVPITYVSKQLGHSSIQVTVDLYAHFIRELTANTSRGWRHRWRRYARWNPQPRRNWTRR
jgi:integrase